MYQIERLLVGLDLSEMDSVLIKYTSHLAKIFQCDKIYFFHVTKSFELPDEIRKKYPDLLAPTDESISESIQKMVAIEWESEYECEKVIEVKEGNPSEQLLRWISIKEVDMLVMGRKKDLKGSGVLPGKIARVAQTSLMMVPEKAQFELKSMLVPVDFSKHSKLAMEQAISIAENDSLIKISALNVYTVPIGYHKTGKSYGEFAAIMKGHAANDFREFMKRNDFPTNIDCHFILDDDDSPADKVFGFAKMQNADIILMGSKGRTGIASILLGSITEKVINYGSEIPLMVVKEKGENMGFLKALLKL